MSHLGLTCEKADDYKKIKVEYKYCATKDVSIMQFGASTANMIPVTIGVNTATAEHADGTWNVQTFDYSSVDSTFWSDSFAYFGFATGVGLMGGDSIYIRSIELVK